MMRVTGLLAAAMLIICGVSAMAQEYTLLREGHPRLSMTAEELRELRDDPTQVRSAASAADRVLAKDRTTAYEEYFVQLPSPQFPPEHDDGWPYWTQVAGELSADLQTVARGYALTGDRSYLAWCRELMVALATWRQWTDPWYGTQPCLDTHQLTRGMCVAVDLLWDDLPPADRDLCVRAIAEKGAEFIYQYGNDPNSYVHHPGAWPNGYAMINTDLGVAGLTLLGERDGAQAWIAQALEKTRLFFDEQGGRDGGLVEGFMYGSAAVDNLMYLVRKADAIVGVNLFDHPYLSQAIYFPAYFIAPGGGTLPAIGDNGGPTGLSPTLIGLAQAMVEVEDSPLAAWYLVKARAADERAKRLAEAPRGLPTARHFRDIDWVAMRSGWGESGSLLAFKSGHVAHHNHLDQNSLLLAWDDEWLLTDPGYQIYNRPYPPEEGMTPEMIAARHEYTYGTVGHNALLVDGEGQKAVRGHIVGFVTSPAVDYAVGDASECYDGLSRWLRHVVSVAPRYHVIFDEIVAQGEARRVHLLLHTTEDGELLVGGRELPIGQQREGETATVRRRGEAVARFVQPGRMVFRHVQWPHCESYGHFLEASPLPALEDDTIAWVVQAGKRESVEIEARATDADGATAVQVRAENGVDTIALSREGEATAGRMRFAGRLGMVRDDRGEVLRYALVEGTTLALGDSTLVASDAPVSVGARIGESLFEASIDCEGAGVVTLHCPVEPDMLRVDGIDQPIDVAYDREATTLTLTLPTGRVTVEAREL